MSETQGRRSRIRGRPCEPFEIGRTEEKSVNDAVDTADGTVEIEGATATTTTAASPSNTPTKESDVNSAESVQEHASNLLAAVSVEDVRSLVDRGIFSLPVEGFLTKQGSLFRNWRRRYSLLLEVNRKSGFSYLTLVYFENESSSKASGNVLITKETKFCAVELKGKPHAFRLVSPERTFLAYADSEEELTKWRHAILAFGCDENSEEEAPVSSDTLAVTASVEGGTSEHNRVYRMMSSVRSFFTEVPSTLTGGLARLRAVVPRDLQDSQRLLRSDTVPHQEQVAMFMQHLSRADTSRDSSVARKRLNETVEAFMQEYKEVDSAKSHEKAIRFATCVEENHGELRQLNLFSSFPKDALYDCIESYLATKTLRLIFPQSQRRSPPRDSRDFAFARRLEALYTFVKPETLDIETPIPDYMRRLWFAAGKALMDVHYHSSPRGKMHALLECTRLIYRSFEDPMVIAMLETGASADTKLEGDESEGDVGEEARGGGGAASKGADDFLPVLIYLVMLTNPPFLPSNLDFIAEYRRASEMDGEEGYYLISFVTAVTFLESVCAKQLNMSEEKFNDALRQGEKAADYSLRSVESDLGALRKRLGIWVVSDTNTSIDDDWEMVDDGKSGGAVVRTNSSGSAGGGALGTSGSSWLRPTTPKTMSMCGINGCQKRFADSTSLQRHRMQKHADEAIGALRQHLSRCGECAQILTKIDSTCPQCGAKPSPK